MKRIIALGILAVLMPAVASAKGSFPMAGCGLGYIAFGHQENSKLYQILGNTVNNIVSPQTFAMTSGTSGCTEDGALKLVAQAQVYAEVNFESLRHEMATGEGEFVSTFATLVGATEENKQEYLKMFQADYAYLYPTAETTSTEMLEHLTQRLERSI